MKMEANDMKAMREALEAVVKEYSGGTMDKEDICRACSTKICGKCKHDGTCWVDKAFAALAKPPRQCDVGDAADQARRYRDTGMTFHTLTLLNALAWAQMPYEAKEGGEE